MSHNVSCDEDDMTEIPLWVVKLVSAGSAYETLIELLQNTQLKVC